jgi:hypothetical protein
LLEPFLEDRLHPGAPEQPPRQGTERALDLRIIGFACDLLGPLVDRGPKPGDLLLGALEIG